MRSKVIRMIVLVLCVCTVVSGWAVTFDDDVNVNSNLTVAGHVGIGTTTPQAKLSLGSSLGNTKLALFDDGSGSDMYGFGIQSCQFRLHVGTSAARFSFLNSAAGTELMTIRGDGKVGIGTTTSSLPFCVRETVAGNGIAEVGGLDGAAFRVDTFDGHVNLDNKKTNGTLFVGRDMNGGIVHVGDSVSGVGLVVPVKGNAYCNNIGIGTTTPTNKLQVAGTTQMAALRITGTTGSYIARQGDISMGVYTNTP